MSYKLEADYGIILRPDEQMLQNALKSGVSFSLPTEGLISSPHVTLISGKVIHSLAPAEKGRLVAALKAASFPPLAFEGVPRLAERPDAQKLTVFLSLTPQAAWQTMVVSVCKKAKIPVDKTRMFHMSVWNNEAGDSKRSIGDITAVDDPKGERFVARFSIKDAEGKGDS